MIKDELVFHYKNIVLKLNLVFQFSQAELPTLARLATLPINYSVIPIRRGGRNLPNWNTKAKNFVVIPSKEEPV